MLDTIKKVMTSDVGQAKLPFAEGCKSNGYALKTLWDATVSVFLESAKCRSVWPFKTAFMTS